MPGSLQTEQGNINSRTAGSARNHGREEKKPSRGTFHESEVIHAKELECLKKIVHSMEKKDKVL